MSEELKPSLENILKGLAVSGLIAIAGEIVESMEAEDE